jgi:hypothetical protein
MDAKKRRLTDRRRFISMVSGMLSGLLLTKPGSVQATKSEIKQFMANIETDLLERSKPSKHPAVAWEHYGDGIRLYKKNQVKNTPFCALNQVGKTIWEDCNGRNTPWEISKLIHQKYLVSRRQAYAECLAFIAVLNTKGAVQL